jgi:hypothetical protein
LVLKLFRDLMIAQSLSVKVAQMLIWYVIEGFGQGAGAMALSQERVSRLVREALSCSKKLTNPIGVITRCIGHDNLTSAAASHAHEWIS